MKIGDTVLNFSLPDERGEIFELYKNLDKKLLLVFYPKDNTPVCSNQLTEYNRSINEFRKAGINIVGISSDSTNSHSKFCKQLGLEFPLLEDRNHSVSRQFQAVNFLGMTKRLLILIDTHKKVIWIDSAFPLFFTKSGKILAQVSSLISK